MFACGIKGNRCAIDQAACRHQDPVDEQGVLLRDIEIGVRRIRPNGIARDPNRQCVFDPWLSLITPFIWIIPDPLDRTCPAEHRRQQITHGQVFNLSVAGCGPDPRTLQEAQGVILAWALTWVLAWALTWVGVGGRWSGCCQTGESRGHSYNAHLYEIAARSPNCGRDLL